MDEWLQRFDRTLGERALLTRAQPVVIAVSGGLDSICLLHALHALASKYSWTLHVAHFNHQLRGRESEADERFVRRASAKLGFPFMTARGRVKEWADDQGISIEMAARSLRHAFLAKAARKVGAQAVALAHHGDDQVETFFLRLLRGTSGEGITGMHWEAPSPVDPTIRLVRPFLTCSKAELAGWAKRHKLAWREDRSNTSERVPRNWVRRKLIPLLRRGHCNGSIDRILRFMTVAGDENDYLSTVATDWLADRRRKTFAQLAVAVQRRVIQQQLRPIGVMPDFDLIEALRVKPDSKVSVGLGAWLERTRAGIVHQVVPDEALFLVAELRIDPVGKGGGTTFGGLEIRWKEATRSGSLRTPQKGVEEFDSDKVGGQIALRHWRPGDVFQPIGTTHAVKLQDLFTDLKVPRARRRGLVVAEAVNRGIFWVEGLRIGECFKLDKGTRRRLKWAWHKISHPPVAGSELRC